MAKAIKIDVTFPSGQTNTFRSIRAVARMLKGAKGDTGGLRKTISLRAGQSLYTDKTLKVRNNAVIDQKFPALFVY